MNAGEEMHSNIYMVLKEELAVPPCMSDDVRLHTYMLVCKREVADSILRCPYIGEGVDFG